MTEENLLTEPEKAEEVQQEEESAPAEQDVQADVEPEPKEKAPKKKRGRKPAATAVLYATGPIPHGARGEVVGRIQDMLGVKRTEVLDKRTTEALVRFQGRRGLSQTGRVDVATRNALGV